MKRLLLTLALILTAGTAGAQNAEERDATEVYVQQARPSLQQTAPVSRAAATDLLYDRLSGRGRSALNSYFLNGFAQNGNFALVIQEGQGNTAYLEQDGARNLAVMAQQGAGNTTYLLQEGAGNIYGSWLKGDNNFLSLTQDGTDNVYLYAFQGDDHVHAVQQIGTGLQTTQLGAGSAPVSIQQIGNDMQVIVRHR